MLRKTDFLWIFAYPIYQIVGTIRHEGSHALVATLEGAKITKFVFLPTISERGGVIWGCVAYIGQTSWLTTFAPYLCDFLTCMAIFRLCITIKRMPRWIWLNLVIIGLLSPFLDTACNYLGVFGNLRNDASKLCIAFGAYPVHIYFALTMLLYFACFFVVLRHSRKQADTNL